VHSNAVQTSVTPTEHQAASSTTQNTKVNCKQVVKYKKKHSGSNEAVSEAQNCMSRMVVEKQMNLKSSNTAIN